jgi:hypothetical protein
MLQKIIAALNPISVAWSSAHPASQMKKPATDGMFSNFSTNENCGTSRLSPVFYGVSLS